MAKKKPVATPEPISAEDWPKHNAPAKCSDCKTPIDAVKDRKLHAGTTMRHDCPSCGLSHFTGLPESVVGGKDSD